MPNLLLSAFMGVCVWTISLLNVSSIVMVLIQIPLGILIYVTGSVLLKLDSFYYVRNQIQPIWHKMVGKFMGRK